MRLHRLRIILWVGLLCGGCSSGLQGVGAGATAAGDANNCVQAGSAIGSRLQIHQTQHFVLLSADSDVAAGQFLDQVYQRFYESCSQAGFALNAPPDKLICVSLASYSQLEAYGRQADGTNAEWMDGYYSYQTNRIAVVHSAGGFNTMTTSHELAHQLAFNSGLQRRGVAYPFWITEGLATNFEAPSPQSCGLEAKGSRYQSRLAQAKAGRRLMPLEQFIAMTTMSAAQERSAGECYAQAWGLFRYLMQTHRPWLRQYMAELASPWSAGESPASMRSHFIRVFGPIEPLEKDFLRFAQTQ